MADVVVTAQTAEHRLNSTFGLTGKIRAQACKYQRIGGIAITSSGDTLDLSAGPAIVGIAWEPVDSTDPIAVTHSAGIVTFTGTAGSTGWLHVWSVN
jgi:hypothetical protein